MLTQCNFKAHQWGKEGDKGEGSRYKMPSLISTQWSFHWSALLHRLANITILLHPSQVHWSRRASGRETQEAFEMPNESDKQDGETRKERMRGERRPGSTPDVTRADICRMCLDINLRCKINWCRVFWIMLQGPKGSIIWNLWNIIYDLTNRTRIWSELF